MAKKRKLEGQRRQRDVGRQDDGQREFRTRLIIDSYEDVADPEDGFRLGQDRVLLEDSPARKRQRRMEDKRTYHRTLSCSSH